MNKWLQWSNPKIIRALNHSKMSWYRLLQIRHQIDLACLIILGILFLTLLVICYFKDKKISYYLYIFNNFVMIVMVIIMIIPIIGGATYGSNCYADGSPEEYYSDYLLNKYNDITLSSIFPSSTSISCDNILIKHPKEITKTKHEYQKIHKLRHEIQYYNQLRIKNIHNTRKWKLYNEKYQTAVEAYHVAYPKKIRKRVQHHVNGLGKMFIKAPHLII